MGFIQKNRKQNNKIGVYKESILISLFKSAVIIYYDILSMNRL